MAIDTEQKRRAALGYCRGAGALPAATGTSNPLERSMSLADYAQSGSPPPPTPSDGAGGNAGYYNQLRLASLRRR